MAGYLDAYGAGDEQRERRTKRIALWSVGAAVVLIVLYFTFRTWPQERVMKQFLTLLRQKEYQDAYKLWGCTQDSPCKYYPPEKFTEDWGPSGAYADISAAHIENVDDCDAGVVFTLVFPKGEPVGLYVLHENNVISFAPWARCPGPHLHLWEFLKARFS
jgi:hypothetical protein